MNLAVTDALQGRGGIAAGPPAMNPMATASGAERVDGAPPPAGVPTTRKEAAVAEPKEGEPPRPWVG